MKGKHSYRGIGLSIDWIHNLVYYEIENKIFVLNMTERKYKYMIIEEGDMELILDLSVNPLDSILFYSISTWNDNCGKIMKASQDGSNRIELRRQNINFPLALTIDLVLRKLFWIDNSRKFSSIDFDGNNFITFGRHERIYLHTFTYILYYMQIFGNNIYWTNYGNSILKTKVGVNNTQINYLITSETSKFSLFKIIDVSLQPNSTNRCVNNNCSHICIPINTNEYRCICPQIKLQNDTKYVHNQSTQSANNESLLAFHKPYGYFKGLFTAKFGKTINQINESDSHLLVETDVWSTKIDYSLRANVIIWKDIEYYNSQFCRFYAIPINKR